MASHKQIGLLHHSFILFLTRSCFLMVTDSYQTKFCCMTTVTNKVFYILTTRERDSVINYLSLDLLTSKYKNTSREQLSTQHTSSVSMIDNCVDFFSVWLYALLPYHWSILPYLQEAWMVSSTVFREKIEKLSKLSVVFTSTKSQILKRSY